MTEPVQEGEVVGGKYRVERVLGRGGMGVVVAARHIELDEHVALKFLLPAGAAEPEHVARFLKEARAAVRIKNEHIARVLDVGQLASGAPYIVMEYLEGSDLGALVHTRGPVPVDDAVDYVIQACEAIANAHALGIVHRDLKPSNLMLVNRSDGSACVKVLDFGISKIASSARNEGALSMTKTAAFLGSPPYMSPEQMMSAKDADERTDIWALGAILYELLTGQPPFVAETLPALGALIATSEPEPIRVLRPEVSVGVQAVVARCLKKQRQDRFANVAELVQALAPFAPARARVSVERAVRVLQSTGALSQRGRATPSAPTALRGQGLSSLTATAGEPSPPIATASSWGGTASVLLGRRRRMIVVAGALVVLTATVAAAVIALSGRDSSAPAGVASAIARSPVAPVASSSVKGNAPPSIPAASLPPIAAPLESFPREEPSSPPAPRPTSAPRSSALEPSRPPSRTPSRPASAPGQKSAYDEM